jgi:hypothetical protein
MREAPFLLPAHSLFRRKLAPTSQSPSPASVELDVVAGGGVIGFPLKLDGSIAVDGVEALILALGHALLPA